MLTEFTYRTKNGSETTHTLDGQFIRSQHGSVWAFASESDAQQALRNLYADVIENRDNRVTSEP